MKTQYNFNPFTFILDQGNTEGTFYDVYYASECCGEEDIGSVKFWIVDMDLFDEVILDGGFNISSSHLVKLADSVNHIKKDIWKEDRYLRALKHYYHWHVGDIENLNYQPKYLSNVFEWAINKLEQQ